MTVKWWEAGGLHVHITYPDRSWTRRYFKKHEWWKVDQVIFELQFLFGKDNVEVLA